MGVGSRARARGGIARGGPVLCFFGVSEFESSRGRRENFFSFFFWPRLIFSQGGIGTKRIFSSNLIALLVVATRIERRY